ncbi:hypothetical protein COEREDRAFT_88615 [Coemansia reversa NRRL 1564]|uniref:Uncharacterized protein n=1 Tax=Coemansia reversa (strain ATCC 12441 / NRRL 1564) TaxID=763665 RepID=A0A2G5B691_COERN|nr:hypothetical protein COEREDRAFT_88615 [Coemansia reversa NRRL 1564]|eukprot:PIA14518.1 hypothetical protein COEREDRAFT_88615 [Coemansia reversa NRRL 1564]
MGNISGGFLGTVGNTEGQRNLQELDNVGWLGANNTPDFENNLFLLYVFPYRGTQHQAMRLFRDRTKLDKKQLLSCLSNLFGPDLKSICVANLLEDIIKPHRNNECNFKDFILENFEKIAYKNLDDVDYLLNHIERFSEQLGSFMVVKLEQPEIVYVYYNNV